MKKLKKLTSLLLAMLMVTSVFSFANVTAFAAVTNGDCGANGDNVKFTYDSKTQTLTIFGEGAMENFNDEEDTPFDYYTVDNFVVSEGVTTIGDFAFAFADMECSKGFSLPTTLKSIGKSAFGGISLKTINLPEGLESIGEAAFALSDLTSIKLPSTLKSIGDYAFAMTDISGTCTISKDITNIGDGAFGDTDISKYSVAEDNTNYCSYNDILFNKDKTVLSAYPTSKQGKSYSIPTSVKSIGKLAFCGTSLTTVTIPKSISVISHGAFAYSELSSISIPYSIKTIGESAFAYTALKSVYIPNCVQEIGSGAFYSEDLKSATIPASVTKIGENAFGSLAYDEEKEELSNSCKLYVYQNSYAAKYAKSNDYKYAYKTVSNLAYKRTEKNITVTWNALAGANGYKVYKYNGKTKKYDLYKTLSGKDSTSFTVSCKNPGTAVTFKVYPYQTYASKNYIGTYKTIYTATKTSKVTLKSVSSPKKGNLKVAWKNSTGYKSGYEIRISTDKNFKKNVKYKFVSASKTSATYSGFSSNKTYYVQVRSYKIINNQKTYGSWNNTKSVKCK